MRQRCKASLAENRSTVFKLLRTLSCTALLLTLGNCPRPTRTPQVLGAWAKQVASAALWKPAMAAWSSKGVVGPFFRSFARSKVW